MDPGFRRDDGRVALLNVAANRLHETV